jgi:hypothetical protein
MSRLRQEMDLIPRTAWAIAVCVWLTFFLVMMEFPFHMDPEGRNWPLAGKLALSVLPGIPLFLMRYVMWTWLAILIPNAIGIILYFVLRDPLLTPCTRCGFQARPGFAFCPQCGAPLSAACPQCRRAVEPSWTHCANCGAALAASTAN